MRRLVVVHADGRRQTLDAAEGESVMQALTGAGIDGIVAECGGSAMCATCHVYIDEEWAGRVPKPLANERAMLECTAAERRFTSRLSCQIKLTSALDGLMVHVPMRQQ